MRRFAQADPSHLPRLKIGRLQAMLGRGCIMNRFLPAVILITALANVALAQDAAPNLSPGALLREHIVSADLAECFNTPELADVNLQSPDLEEIEAGPRRIVIALDASGSMAGQTGGISKIDAAKTAVTGALSTWPADIDVGLVAFGHQGNNDEAGRAQSCTGVEALVTPTTDRDALAAAITALSATGWTPLASAITTAAARLDPDEGGLQAIYVVSDGVETCDGDPVEAARAVAESDLTAVVNIIGFDLPPEDRAALMAVAEAGGGAFLDAPDGAALGVLLRNQAGALWTGVQNQTAAQATVNINTTRLQMALNRAQLCVNRTIATERTRMSSRSMRLSRLGVTQDIYDDMADRLTARHQKAVEMLNRFAEALTTQQRVMIGDIEGQLDQALGD